MFPPVWYRIYDHEAFDNDMAYRAIAYTMPSESAWGYLTFITTGGHTVSVMVWRCTALRPDCGKRFLDPSLLYRPLTETEKLIPRARKFNNPDLQILDK